MSDESIANDTYVEWLAARHSASAQALLALWYSPEMRARDTSWTPYVILGSALPDVSIMREQDVYIEVSLSPTLYFPVAVGQGKPSVASIYSYNYVCAIREMYSRQDAHKERG